jgi:uncharacterized protein (TIGR03067 family)
MFAQSAGGHNAPYWTREVGHSMAVQYTIIQMQLAAARAGADGDKGKGDKFDPAKLVGSWKYVSGVKNGEKVKEEHFKNQTVTITKDMITLKAPDATFVMKYQLDTKKSPVGIKMEITQSPFGAGAKAAGIIEVNGDDLRICYAPLEGDAPKTFEAKEGSKYHLFTLKRAK